MRAQRGQVMAFIAVALAIVLMPLAAYAIDVRTVSTAAAALQEATATAALEAAQQLDEIDFRAGGVTVIGTVATVAASELVQLPLDFLPTRMVRLEARASATLTGGYDRPSS